jgi:adenylyltransferase/sulfurtransferase
MAVEDRYSRQTRFPGIGPDGQQKLGEARVVVIGCGALGTVCAEMLVRAGVGCLRLIDRDFVEWPNLQRQSLFTEADAEDGLPKATSAARALRAINSTISVEPLVADLDLDNLDVLCGDADLLLDGTDNFETRYLLNDYAVREGLPWIYGAAVGSYGLGLAVVPGKAPCLRCIFPELPPPGEGETCETAGVISPVIHMVAAFEVAAALRILVGHSPPAGLFQVDVWNDQWRLMDVGGPSPDCPCCAYRDYVFLRGGAGSRPERLCGRNAVQVRPMVRQSVDLSRLARQLAPVGRVRLHPELLRFSTSNYEITVFPDGRAIVKGTDNPAEARSIYARYVGA